MPQFTIGILALQGGFAKHKAVLQSLRSNVKEVRKPSDLIECDALILPGGESTTIQKQIQFIGLADNFREFASKKPVFGTCAGLILMSKKILGNDSLSPFGLLDISVERNAFGSQTESFKTIIQIQLHEKKTTPISFPAIFIRAPRIRSYGKEVKVLASHLDEPILVQQGHFLGATFHPELVEDSSIHAYFLSMLRAS